MIRRKLPILATATFAITLALFVVSLGELELGSSRSHGMDGGWWFSVRHGRLIASHTHMLSSKISRPAEPSWRNAWGFSYESSRFAPAGIVAGKIMSEHVAIPTYPLPLATGLLLAWRLMRSRRTKPGACTACGYDLRASPGRCPECGTEPAARATACP
jgi:hypothetical protein